MANNTPGERLSSLETWCKAKDQKDDERHEGNQYWLKSIDQNHTKRLDEILTQVTKTNGRVDKLESWQDKAKGAWWIIGIGGVVIGFLIDKLWK